MSEATREIMWNIPPSFKVGMYVFFIISLGFFFYGFYKQFRFITSQGGSFKGENGLLPKRLNWRHFWRTIFLQGKIPRDRHVGFFHGLIYFGFIILWIATDLVAIHYDTPFKVFQGTTYIVISFLADIAGLMILAGIAFAYHRRYIKKPDYLKATKPNRELFMYVMLVLLVVIGYVIEGLRIFGTGMPELERYVAPVGWALASLIGYIGMGDEALALFYRSLWFLHMLNTMVFVAVIPFSKFSHFIYAPFAALLTPPMRGAVLKPMDFENEEAETFGLGKISELSAKNKFDAYSCVECGRCTQVCPATMAQKPLDPKLIITKTRDFIYQTHAAGKDDGSFWPDEQNEAQVFAADELDSCTTCGACMEECPMSIEHVDVILNLKRYKALTLGDLPPSAADAVQKIKTQGNPWGISQDDRFNWAQGFDVPVIETGKKVDYLYYVGCAGSYDAANQKVVKDTVMLLKKAGVDFVVLGKTEKCNGDPVRRFGDEYSFFEIAIENIANLNQYEFDKVVTHCPHCLHTIGKEYAKFEDGSFITLHHTELLHELIKEGRLTPTKEINEELTYHDPCYLGRHHGTYDAPREVLNAIPGVQIKEMPRSKDRSLCCGMGGGNMWYEIEEGQHLANNRLKEIGETKVEKLASSCSYCMINFNSSKAHFKETEELEVEDVASILAKSTL